MTSNDNYKKRITHNSLILYARMLVTMLVSLYTSRIVLDALGANDYGLYNAVGGLAVMFGFLNMSLTVSSSRFLNFEMGKNECTVQSLRKIFSTCFHTHLLLAAIIALLCETIGLYFLHTQMQIPPGRMAAAQMAYHTSVVSVCTGIIVTPLSSAIIAHEKMGTFAYISIAEALGKLAIAFILTITTHDRLKVYSVLLLLISIMIQCLYAIYCVKNFNECKKLQRPDKKLMRRIFSFTSWNLIGDSAYAAFSQGLNILLNMFFGTVVNAARGIAIQINGMALRFVQSFQTAVNPQLIQSYSNGNDKKMHELIMMSSRYTLFLLTIIAVPVFFCIDFLLSIWLKEVPSYTAVFTKIIIAILYFDALGNPMTVAINATGDNKSYQLIVGGTLLLICPLSYVCLKLGAQPYAVFLCHLFFGFIAHLFRIRIVHKKTGLEYTRYFKEIFLKGGIIIISSFSCTYLTSLFVSNSWLLLLCSVTVTCVIVFTIGLKNNEKTYILSKIRQ